MNKLAVWLAILVVVGATSIEDAAIWDSLEERDVVPFWWKEYFMQHKPDNQDEFADRIVGGQIATPNAFPHQVGLGLSTIMGQQSWCGGSVISEYFILTAAHCMENVQYINIILGAHDRESSLEPGRQTIRVGRANVIIHSGWSMQSMLNDIALIRLSTPLTFSDKIKPIALPTRTHAAGTFEGQTAIISGWGNYESKRLSKYLRYTQSRVINNSICKTYFNQVVHSSTLCLDGSQGRGTCHGDSGGPLIIQTANSGYVLAGLTSFGNPYSCEARWPTAFTRVTSYLDWISMYTGIPIKN